MRQNNLARTIPEAVPVPTIDIDFSPLGGAQVLAMPHSPTAEDFMRGMLFTMNAVQMLGGAVAMSMREAHLLAATAIGEGLEILWRES